MIKNGIKYSLLCVLLVTLIFSSCAKRGNITGGLKDTLAPVMIKAFPANFSTNFNSSKIEIEFDELIKIKDVNTQLIISPPLKYKPLITPQSAASKKITITLKDTLKENTTYSFNFGQSITDNNESNPYSQFKYVVSTGSYIDSLTIVGEIKDAFNKEHDNFVSVQLYDAATFNDSTVYNEQPLYITNTLDSLKYFSLENLKEGTYKIVALKDKNSNGKYDSKSDKIGFLKASIQVPTDTIYQLELFKEVTEPQVSKLTQESNNKWFLGYTGEIESLNITAQTENNSIPLKVLPYPNQKNDSIQLFTPTLKENDSIFFKIESQNLKKEYRRKVKELKSSDSLKTEVFREKYSHFNAPFVLNANTPLKKVDVSKISLIDADSVAVDFKVVLDALKNRLTIQFKKEENTKYNIDFLPNALIDYNNTTNDSLNYKVATRQHRDYGNLIIVPENGSKYPYLLEIIKDKDIVVASATIKNKEAIKFELIEPNSYTLRIIEDENNNGKWDTGDFLNKKQAEKVIYFSKKVDVRANWDVEQVFYIP